MNEADVYRFFREKNEILDSLAMLLKDKKHKDCFLIIIESFTYLGEGMVEVHYRVDDNDEIFEENVSVDQIVEYM